MSPTFTNAGLENAAGVITATVIKDPTDPRWTKDADVLAWREWMTKYYPQGDQKNMSVVYYYVESMALEKVLRAAGPNPTREGIMRQVTSLQFQAPMLNPGIALSYSPTDYDPFKKMQLQRFDGANWNTIGQPSSGE